MTFLTFKSNTMNNEHRPQGKYIYNQNKLTATKTKKKRQQRKEEIHRRNALMLQ